jgi:hypothetical protein
MKSTVLSLPLKLVFPVVSNAKKKVQLYGASKQDLDVSDFFWQFSIDENLDQGLPGLVRVLPRE